jgi:hypothetical protein
MAVRAFDLHEASVSLPPLERVALSRRDARRQRQRTAVVATFSLSVPFVVALIVLGVVH